MLEDLELRNLSGCDICQRRLRNLMRAAHQADCIDSRYIEIRADLDRSAVYDYLERSFRG